MRAAVLVVIVLYVALDIVPSIICWLKGKRRWAVLGFLSLWHLIPMVRLAKPDSWWARRYYDDHKMLRSRARFDRVPVEYQRPDAESLNDFTAEEIVFQDKITRKAWMKAHKQRA